MQEITLQEPEGDDLKGRLTGLEPYLPARFWVSFEGSGVSLGDAVDEAGRFTLHGIPSGGHGTIIVRAQNPEQESGWLVARRPVFHRNPDAVFTIPLPEPSRIEGTIRHGRQPCAGCLLDWDAPFGSGASVTTAADGQYSVLLVRPDEYRVIITDEEGRVIIRRKTITGSTQADFQLSGGKIKGEVLQEEAQEPAAAADVTLFDSTGRMIASLVIGSAGEFVFDGLSEGTYRVIASLGEQTAEKDVQVRSNEEKPLTLLLKEASSVRLHLLDGVAGQPPRWYEAPLYDAAGRLVLSKKRRSPDDGLISLPVSGDGPFTAVVASGGHGIVTVRELHAGASPRTVSLMPGSELILQGADQDRGQFWLMDGQGHPLALNSSTPPGAMPFVGPVTILDDLPAGRYVARYTARDSTQTGPWEIQLKPQAPTFLELKP